MHWTDRARDGTSKSQITVPFIMLLLALLAACAPMAPVVTTAEEYPASVPPTEASTAVPMPTSTAATLEGAYATQDAARQATIVARATASPFPTSGPSTVQLGEPSVATARRDGLSLEVRLPKDTYLAGEGNRAEVILRNDSPETVIVHCDREHSSWLVLLDDQGHELAPWPWMPMSGPGWNRCFGKELASGQVLTDTPTLQIPVAPEGTGQIHALWAETRFSRPSPDTSQGSDNLWLHLDAGPIPLQVIPPEPAQHLVAELQADREGWQLRLTDAEGQVPSGPLWGFQEITSFSSASAGPLHDSPDGTWSAAWRENEWDDESEICLRIWVAAPGYVTAVVTETVPGTGETRCMFRAMEPPLRQTFPSLEAAQAALAYPLYRPGFLPDGAQLEEVRVETMPYEPQGWGDAGQTYRLPDGGWLELSQQATAEPYAGFGWGPARYDPEASVVTIGQTTGYTIRLFGWWLLDWKCGDAGLELRAPVEALSLEELMVVAAGVKSPDGTCPPAPTPAPPPTAPAPPTATPVEPTPASGQLAMPPPGLVYWTPRGLWQVNLEGQPQFLLDRSDAVLSPDGKQALYAEDDLWLVDLKTNEWRNLTRTPDRRECCPQWWPARPDVILFGSWLLGEEDQVYESTGFLTAMNLDGAGYHVLDPEGACRGWPNPSPDGQTIAYASGPYARLYHWETGLEPFDAAAYGLSEPRELVMGSPSWSPNGQQLAWVVGGEFDGRWPIAVVVFNLAKQTARVLPPYEPMGMGGWPSAAVWSPGGQWLAFDTIAQNADERGIRLASAGGDKEHRLDGRNPVWSPDGRLLAFNRLEAGRTRTIWLAKVGTWQLQQVALPADAILVGWRATE